MPAPSENSPALPLRVAECGGCGQLFAVYATEGVVSCPACATETPVGSLETAELAVAAPVTLRVEAEARLPEPPPEPETPPQPELEPLPTAAERETAELETAEPESPAATHTTDQQPLPVADPTPEPEPEPKRPPTVAEWLRQSEPPAPRPVAPAPEPVAEPTPAPKPSLSESLGWQPGSLNLEASDENTPPVEDTPRAESDEPAETLGDFRFDFGSTPLSEQAQETAQAAESIDDEAVADPPQVAEFDWTATDEPKPRRWAAPVGALAGLLLVAGPAAYLWATWPDDELATTRPAPRALSDAAKPPALTADGEPVEEPLVVHPTDEPAAEPALFADDAPEPRVDEQTQPASYDEPPLPFEGPATPAPLAEDPFNTPLPESAPPQQPEPAPVGDRYGGAGDRYGVADPSVEPASFEADAIGIDPPREPLAPVERTPLGETIGLVNAPTYGVADLAAALAPAEESGRAFAVGTMADPEQVQTMGQHYARLCHLAQVLTLFDPEAAGTGGMTTELAAADVFKKLFREERPRAESRQVAGPWIAWRDRPHGGVFFAGVPSDVRAAGAVTEYTFPVGDTPTRVVMAEAIDVDRFINAGAQQVGVIGVVVENPREWIAGYEGDAERVVWARKTLALPRADAL